MCTNHSLLHALLAIQLHTSFNTMLVTKHNKNSQRREISLSWCDERVLYLDDLVDQPLMLFVLTHRSECRDVHSRKLVEYFAITNETLNGKRDRYETLGVVLRLPGT